MNTTRETTRETAFVKWFNSAIGYGFLTPTINGSEQGEDLFVHVSAMKVRETREDLSVGVKVSFIREPGIAGHKEQAGQVLIIEE